WLVLGNNLTIKVNVLGGIRAHVLAHAIAIGIVGVAGCRRSLWCSMSGDAFRPHGIAITGPSLQNSNRRSLFGCSGKIERILAVFVSQLAICPGLKQRDEVAWM